MKVYSKLSNKTTIGIRLKFILISLLLHLPLFFILFFIRTNPAFKEEYTIILGASFLFFVLLFYRARYFEIDSSGEVISIRSYHPIFRSFEKRAEFPKQKLQDYKVRKRNCGVTLQFSLKMLEKKNASIQYSVQGFSKSNVKKLEKSLMKIKETYQVE